VCFGKIQTSWEKQKFVWLGTRFGEIESFVVKLSIFWFKQVVVVWRCL
jgi:hypothetical protein